MFHISSIKGSAANQNAEAYLNSKISDTSKRLNSSNAKGTFVQSTKMQRFLNTI